MKMICMLNILALVIVLAGNFELSDLPYFKGVVQGAFARLMGFLFKVRSIYLQSV